jgi:hypothetical protein
MNDASGMEALKAQAVAARTYTMLRMSSAGSAALYAVVDTTADRVATAASAGRTSGSTKASTTSRRCGVAGQAAREKGAGPVGEALIMTAAGLAVALPAVFAYNAFTRLNRVVLTDLDAFAHDLHAFFTVGKPFAGNGAQVHALRRTAAAEAA